MDGFYLYLSLMSNIAIQKKYYIAAIIVGSYEYNERRYNDAKL